MSEPSARDSELRVSRVVSQILTSWNRIAEWLKSVQHLKAVA